MKKKKKEGINGQGNKEFDQKRIIIWVLCKYCARTPNRRRRWV